MEGKKEIKEIASRLWEAWKRRPFARATEILTELGVPYSFMVRQEYREVALRIAELREGILREIREGGYPPSVLKKIAEEGGKKHITKAGRIPKAPDDLHRVITFLTPPKHLIFASIEPSPKDFRFAKYMRDGFFLLKFKPADPTPTLNFLKGKEMPTFFASDKAKKFAEGFGFSPQPLGRALYLNDLIFSVPDRTFIRGVYFPPRYANAILGGEKQ